MRSSSLYSSAPSNDESLEFGDSVYGDQIAVPCVFMRGGTSRGAMLKREHLPRDPEVLSAVIAAIYGSPDVRQINGLGGATGQTSKVCIVGPPSVADADVDFTFGQVRINEAAVDFAGNCGNMTSAVAAFAVDEGYVSPEIGSSDCTVRIYLTNTDQIVVTKVPVVGSRAAVQGDRFVDGVPGSGAPIAIEFTDTVATLGQGLLPLGELRTKLTVGNDHYEVSVVDVGNAAVFIRAEDVGLRGTELPDELTEHQLAKLVAIRSEVAAQMGLCESPAHAQSITPATPKIYAVSPPRTYTSMSGAEISRDRISLCGRGLIMGKPHESYAATVGICTAVAAAIGDTVVSDVISLPASSGPLAVEIGHPSGIMSVQAQVESTGPDYTVKEASFILTARRIMSGFAYVPLQTLTV